MSNEKEGGNEIEPDTVPDSARGLKDTEADGPGGELRLKKQKTADQLEAEMQAEGFFGKNCYWITCSLAAGITMGTGSFIFASNYADLGLAGGGLCGPGVFVVFLAIWVFRQAYYRCKTGRWTFAGDDEHPDYPLGKSRLVKKDGTLRWSNLIPFLGNVTVNVSYLIVMTYAWHFAKLGDIN